MQDTIWVQHAKDFHARLRLPRRARRDLAFMGIAEPPKITMSLSRSSPFSHDITLTRKGKAIHADYSFVHPQFELPTVRRRLSSLIYQFTHCSNAIETMSGSIGDGFEGTQTPFVFSSNRPDKIPIPDCYQFMLKGFERCRVVADADDKPWRSRRRTLRWRGTVSGHGRDLAEPGIEWDPTVKARLRLCVLANKLDDIDCKITLREPHPLAPRLRHFNVLGDWIDESDWINDRYALDIDGMTNTWSNFVARLHFGCCVLKVGSQFGYRQWYYDRIQPWVHYVPVKADMSDLAEKLEWVRAHDDEAEQIARNGQAFVRTLTMQNNTRDAVEIIETHYLGKPVTDFGQSITERPEA